MRKLSVYGVAASLLFTFNACKNMPKQEVSDALDKKAMNTEISAGEDFYQYAVGNWLKANPVPSTESRWGSFNIVADNNKKILREIMETCAKTPQTPNTNAQRIGDLYALAMDSTRRNKERHNPIKPYFADIQAVQSPAQLRDLIGKWHGQGLATVYRMYVGPDAKSSQENAVHLFQSGTSLPDRDYYLKEDPKSVEIRQKYKQHIQRAFVLLGEENEKAVQNAEIILALETQLAKAFMDKVTLRNPQARYNPMTLDEMKEKYPNTDWKGQMRLLGLSDNLPKIIVGQPDFLSKLDELWASESLENWKVFLKWKIINNTADYLGDDMGEHFFAFNGKVLSGAKERKPRWERSLMQTDNLMGEPLGELFVEKTFKPEAKKRMLDMVANLRAVFRERIQNLDWMSAETKTKAVAKLDKFTVKIGYPDVWKDYSTLKINPKLSYCENVMNCVRFEYKRNLDKYGKPVDKTEWGMSPQTVNAYYSPQKNEIVFPAGILQPPFFDMNADDALIYGAIGSVIGHEMTHGFDDSGRQYDGDGNLSDWWTKEDADKFQTKAQMVIDQYNALTVLDTMHVNGKLTLGENLADIGGLSIALDAFQRTPQGKANAKINGMTAEQRFFWSWAYVWKNNITDEALRQRIMTDPHSPGVHRCNGTVMNLDGFYKAYSVKEGDKMWRKPNERARIW